jgi:phage tail P2-like protein
MTILLPPNATPTERAVEAATSRIAAIPVVIGDIWNPATCPAHLLPWLAWALSVDVWDAGWSEQTQRAVIAASTLVHRRKGTIGAIKAAMAAMGYGDVDITEGRNTLVGGNWRVGDAAVPVGGAQHWADYWLTISAAIPPAEVAKIANRMAQVAPARCHLTKIKVASVQTIVGGPWAVGDPTITVGATYPVEITNGIAT